jgi:hypothetical protein
MKEFKDIEIGSVFFEDCVGEHLIKVSKTDSHVYELENNCEYVYKGEPICYDLQLDLLVDDEI